MVHGRIDLLQPVTPSCITISSVSMRNMLQDEYISGTSSPSSRYLRHPDTRHPLFLKGGSGIPARSCLKHQRKRNPQHPRRLETGASERPRTNAKGAPPPPNDPCPKLPERRGSASGRVACVGRRPSGSERSRGEAGAKRERRPPRRPSPRLRESRSS